MAVLPVPDGSRGRAARTAVTRGDGETLDEVVVLARDGAAFRIADADLPQMRAFQAQVLDWKAAGHEASGSMRMSVTGGIAGPVPPGHGGLGGHPPDR